MKDSAHLPATAGRRKAAAREPWLKRRLDEATAEEQAKSGDEQQAKTDYGKDPFRKSAEISDLFEGRQLLRVNAEHNQETDVFGPVKKGGAQREQTELLQRRAMGEEPDETKRSSGDKEEAVDRGEKEIDSFEE